MGVLACAVSTSVNFASLIVTLVLLSNLLVALYLVFMKSIMIKTESDEWKLLTHSSAVLSMILIPTVVLSGEYTTLVTAEDIGGFYSHLIYNGLMGFLVNASLFVLVKYTSALTACIFELVRTCVQMVLCFFIWHDSLSVLVCVNAMLRLTFV